MILSITRPDLSGRRGTGMFGVHGHACGTGVAALVALWAALSPAVSSASPTIHEATSFVRRELTRICGNRDLSKFDRLNDQTMFRTCVAEVSPNGLSIVLRYRSAEADDRSDAEAKRGGKITTTVSFLRDSWFFCDTNTRRGMVGLHLSCEADVRFDGRICVERKDLARRIDRTINTRVDHQSIAKLMELKPEQCHLVERALNFLIQRGESRRTRSTRDYFLQN